MTKLLAMIIGATAMIAAIPLSPAATSGDWPCVQRKVPEISAASVWQGAALDQLYDQWRGQPVVSDLVQRLAVRRTTQEEAKDAIDQFAETTGAEREARLGQVMAGLLETVNAERADVIAGLERFGAAQKQLAALLRRENTELATMRNSTNSDPRQIEQRLEQLNWNLRIFNERQKSLSSVCEVPVLIEKRLYGLSKAIEKSLQKSK